MPGLAIILRELELNSIDSSGIFRIIIISSLHERHCTGLVESFSWKVNLPPLLNKTLTFGTVDTSLRVKSWIIVFLLQETRCFKSGTKIHHSSLRLWLSFFWLKISILNSPKFESTLDFWSSLVVLINDDSEELAVHWWLNLDSSLKFDVVVPFLPSFVPLSIIVGVEVHTILRCFKRNSIDLSLLVAAAAVSSSHQRHFRDFVVLAIWHSKLKPHAAVTLSSSIVESRSGIESWLDPVVIPFAR